MVQKSIKIVEGVSKAGNSYKALDIKVGDYEGRLFPTRFEMNYLTRVLTGGSQETASQPPTVAEAVDAEKAADFLNDETDPSII